MRIQINPGAVAGWLLYSFSLCLIMQAQTLPQQLNIVVLEGEGSTNDVRQHTAHLIVVEVHDENQKPIPGAAVVFTLPTEGATGEFHSGGKNLTLVTDERGRVSIAGFRMNQVEGKVPIHVSASYRGVSARATITQYIVVPPGAKVSSGHGHGVLAAVLVIVAGAATGGAYYATHKSSSTSMAVITPSPTPIGITPGAGTIMGGH